MNKKLDKAANEFANEAIMDSKDIESINYMISVIEFSHFHI